VVLGALRFQSLDLAPLAGLTEGEWKKALEFSDRSGLTLPLATTCPQALPDWVRCRLDRDLANNAARWDRVKATYSEAACAFQTAGLEFAVLKGFTHCPRFVSDPRLRPHGDIDLHFPQENVNRAYDVVLKLGYEPIRAHDSHPLNHLPTLVRKTGWEWKGDYFDIEIPVSLELHYRLWQPEIERFSPAGLDRFWERRQGRELDGLHFTGLHPADEAANAALHLLRHLLRGSSRPLHVYEMAWMLHHSADDTSFWNAWIDLHDASLRRLEVICFLLAHIWFDCRLPRAVVDEIEQLPSGVKRWLAEYAWSPLASKFQPNKDELWLHWSLLDSLSGRVAVLRRRLIPERLPGPVDGVHIPDHRLTWRMQFRRRWRFLKYAGSRVLHHARAIPPTIGSALGWFGASIELGVDYWRLFFSEGFYNFGMFVFVFLYNLYLLQLGFDEKFLGLIAGVTTTGNIAGSFLAVFAMQRFGIRPALMASFASIAGLSALRAAVVSAPALLALAAISGLVSSVWPIALAPAVAAVTTEKGRSRGFSFVVSSGIAIGIFGGLAAGGLPGWISRHGISSSIGSYRASLLAGCFIVLLALWPLSRMKMSGVQPKSERRLRRPPPLVVRFVVAMAFWQLGTGLFNPFRNVFFAKQMHLAVDQIGSIFSLAQASQVAAVLLAPIAFRKFGLVRGISGMEFATALILVALASVSSPLAGAAVYCAFMAAQYMGEPGMFTFLMDAVPAGERSSASALNFLVSFGSQAIAAAIAGVLLARFGYPPVLTSAAIICSFAAFLFRVLLARTGPDSPSRR